MPSTIAASCAFVAGTKMASFFCRRASSATGKNALHRTDATIQG